MLKSICHSLPAVEAILVIKAGKLCLLPLCISTYVFSPMRTH